MNGKTNGFATPGALIVLLAMVLFASPLSAAENGAAELHVGVGVAPVQTLFELFTDITLATLSFGTIEPTTETENATLFVEYARPMGDMSQLVMHVDYTRYQKRYEVQSTGTVAGNVTDDFYTLMLGVKRYYVRTGSFGLFLELMGGVSMLQSQTDIDELETNSSVLIAYQITPLGLRLGDRFALDLSVGLGYKGIVGLGASYAF